MKGMEDGNMVAVTAPSSVSVPIKFKLSKPTSSRKRVEAVPEKPAKRQGLKACSKNSNKRTDLKDFSSQNSNKRTDLKDFSSRWGGTSHPYRENHPNVDLHDGNKIEEASKSLLLSPHDSVTADPNDLAGNQLIIQESYDDLEVKIRDLKKETKMYSKELKHFAKACLHLKEENDLLMDELKPWCTPEMMLDLGRSNPDRIQQSNDA